jgi:hypothetical protein
LRHEKGIKSIKKLRFEKSKLEAKIIKKLDCPVLDTGVSGFLKIDRVRVGFEI